jgi:uncharacterized protein
MHTAAELDHLANLLNELPYKNDGMILSQFDGFCAGLIVCPEMIMPSEWLPDVWGSDVEPFFQDPDQAETTITAVMSHYNRVADILANTPDQYEAIYGTEPNNDDLLWEPWIDGFEQAMRFRIDAWEQIVESDDEEAASSVNMIIAMNDVNHGRSELDDTAIDHIDEIATDMIPSMVRTLNAWTKGMPVSEVPLASNIRPVVSDNVVEFPTKKAGRNELCPCGSGKKYKKCCGG